MPITVVSIITIILSRNTRFVLQNLTENLLLLEQNASQINTSSNNLSPIVDDLLTNLSNLNESAVLLRVS